MSAIYELKDKSVCPPGGFIFTRRDGSKSEGPYSENVVNECSVHHGIKPNEAWQKVLHETYNNIAPASREYFITKNTEALIFQNPTFRYVSRDLLLPCPYAYNPGLITVDGDDWLVYRRQMENSDSTVVRMNFRTHENHTIVMPEIYPNEQFEDPRVFWHDNAIHIIISSWRKNWTYKPLLRLFRLDKEWKVEKEILLDYAGNGKGVTQKNWQFWDQDGELWFIYHYAPFQVVRLKDKKVHRGLDLKWKWGEIRGSTPPVKVDDSYFTFFHSRLDHGRSKYYVGCLEFSNKEPFAPISMTMEPLLSSTNKEPNLHWAPLTVFPCGALYKDGTWCVSAGINDLHCALVDFVHSDLVKKMETL